MRPCRLRYLAQVALPHPLDALAAPFFVLDLPSFRPRPASTCLLTPSRSLTSDFHHVHTLRMTLFSSSFFRNWLAFSSQDE